MAYNFLEYLEWGKVDFLFDLTMYDRNDVINVIRSQKNKNKIINGFLNKLIDVLPYFCFEIIYDIEEYKDKVFYIINKNEMKILEEDKLKSILSNTSWGRNYIKYNLEDIVNEKEKNIYFILDYIFNDFDRNRDFIEKLYLHENLHIRYLFMKYVVDNYPEKLKMIYDDITKYITRYTFEQLTFFSQIIKKEDIMKQEDISSLAISFLKSNFDKSIYIKLKKLILLYYKENDLAKLLLQSEEVRISENSYILKDNPKFIDEFKEDANRLFETSSNYQFIILNKYSKYLADEILNNFRKYIEIFSKGKNVLGSIFYYELGRELIQYVDKYLSLSKITTTEYIGGGTTCLCFRIGDYVIKLVRTKWSYEDVICPNLYLINKNYEEHYIRNEGNIVVSGLEVQRYWHRSAKKLPFEVYIKFENELKRLGYYITDTLVNGTCGDNCMLLDSYKDADCSNPESLPDWFKKNPMVLVDRDMVYKLENKHPKVLQESCD